MKKVSQIASGIYQAAKKAAAGAWDWKAEWKKAMKAACAQVINKVKEAVVMLAGVKRDIRIRIESGCYNARRYGRPWIAKVAQDMTFAFGHFFGDDTAGVCEITACVGDVIASGQKDYRQPKNSAPTYYIVGAEGKLDEVSKSDAYKHLNP